MPYARVLNMQYKSSEDLEQTAERWANISMQKTLGFLDALSRTVTKQVQLLAIMLQFTKLRNGLKKRANFKIDTV